jgi:WD40 repeat protein
MKDPLFDRASEIFLDVCDLAPAEREKRIARACGDDAPLLALVRSLLGGDTRPIARLDSPALGRGLVELAAWETSLPERVAGYRILSRIGEGGMGVVFLAEQEKPRRRVALKCIRTPFASSEFLKRFEREAEILGWLNHPGIAQVFEAGTAVENGRPFPYIAMELVDGKPLTEHAAAARLDLPARLELLAEVCDAVHHAHEKGVIHRDLKPRNILVTPEGRPKVLDFGVARAVEPEAGEGTWHTLSGELIGTLPTMSPEQLSRDPSQVDTRSDVYALGVVAFELLAGRLPHDVTGLPMDEVVLAITREPAPRLGSIRRELSGDVETIVAKALEKEKSRRYASVDELAQDLRRVLRQEPIAARPPSFLYHLGKFALRNKTLVGATALAIAALLAGTIVSLGQAARARAAERSSEARAVLARRQSYRASIAAALAALEAHEPREARRYLEEAPEEERRWEWKHLAALLDGGIGLVPAEEGTLAAAFASDPDAVLTLSREGEIARRDRDLDRVLERRSLGVGPLLFADFTADGRTVAALYGPEGGRAATWDTRTGKRTSNVIDLDPSWRLALSEDGTRLLVHDRRKPHGTLRVLALPGGEEVAAARLVVSAAPLESGRIVYGDSYSNNYVQDASRARVPLPTGSFRLTTSIASLERSGTILLGLSDGKILEMDPVSRAPLRALAGHDASVSSIATVPGGDRLASASEDGTLRLWRQGEEGPLSTLCGSAGSPLRSVALAPDARRALAIADDDTVRLWDLERLEGALRLALHTSYVYDVEFSPDGARFASCSWDGTLRTWDAASGEPLAVLEARHPLLDLAWSPDGAFLAAGCKFSGVHRWNAATGEPLPELRIPVEMWVSAVAFSPDGRWIAAGLRVFSHDYRDGVVFDAGTGEVAAEIEEGHTEFDVDVAFSPEGRLFLSSSRGLVAFDLDWKEERRAPPSSPPSSLAVRRDDGLLATGHRDSRIRLWDARTLECLRVLEGHTGDVYGLAFSPDGTRLASGADDGTLRLWDVETGEPLAKLEGHDDYVHAVACSPDGAQIVTASGDGTLRIWDTVPERLRRRGGRDRRRRPSGAVPRGGGGPGRRRSRTSPARRLEAPPALLRGELRTVDRDFQDRARAQHLEPHRPRAPAHRRLEADPDVLEVREVDPVDPDDEIARPETDAREGALRIVHSDGEGVDRLRPEGDDFGAGERHRHLPAAASHQGEAILARGNPLEGGSTVLSHDLVRDEAPRPRRGRGGTQRESGPRLRVLDDDGQAVEGRDRDRRPVLPREEGHGMGRQGPLSESGVADEEEDLVLSRLRRPQLLASLGVDPRVAATPEESHRAVHLLAGGAQREVQRAFEAAPEVARKSRNERRGLLEADRHLGGPLPVVLDLLAPVPLGIHADRVTRIGSVGPLVGVVHHEERSIRLRNRLSSSGGGAASGAVSRAHADVPHRLACRIEDVEDQDLAKIEPREDEVALDDARGHLDRFRDDDGTSVLEARADEIGPGIDVEELEGEVLVRMRELLPPFAGESDGVGSFARSEALQVDEGHLGLGSLSDDDLSSDPVPRRQLQRHRRGRHALLEPHPLFRAPHLRRLLDRRDRPIGPDAHSEGRGLRGPTRRGSPALASLERDLGFGRGSAVGEEDGHRNLDDRPGDEVHLRVRLDALPPADGHDLESLESRRDVERGVGEAGETVRPRLVGAGLATRRFAETVRLDEVSDLRVEIGLLGGVEGRPDRPRPRPVPRTLGANERAGKRPPVVRLDLSRDLPLSALRRRRFSLHARGPALGGCLRGPRNLADLRPFRRSPHGLRGSVGDLRRFDRLLLEGKIPPRCDFPRWRRRPRSHRKSDGETDPQAHDHPDRDPRCGNARTGSHGSPRRSSQGRFYRRTGRRSARCGCIVRSGSGAQTPRRGT